MIYDSHDLWIIQRAAERRFPPPRWDWEMLRLQDEDRKMLLNFTANDAWRHCGKSPQLQLSIRSLERSLVGNIRFLGPLLHSLVFQRCSLDSQPVGRRIWPITMHVSLEVDLCWPAKTVTLFARRFLLLCISCWWTVICQSWLHVVQCVQQWKWIHLQYEKKLRCMT